jgi:hypothetical protein
LKQSINTKEKIMKRNTIASTLVLAVLALGMAAAARADNKGCSNATLKGTFLHQASGFVTSPPAMAGPLAGVGTDTFDGNGHIMGTATLSINGNTVPLTETGTYKVNPDCTGTYTVSSAGGSTSAFFVITDSGDEIQAICTDTGIVLTHIFRKQSSAGDSRR